MLIVAPRRLNSYIPQVPISQIFCHPSNLFFLLNVNLNNYTEKKKRPRFKLNLNHQKAAGSPPFLLPITFPLTPWNTINIYRPLFSLIFDHVPFMMTSGAIRDWLRNSNLTSTHMYRTCACLRTVDSGEYDSVRMIQDRRFLGSLSCTLSGV